MKALSLYIRRIFSAVVLAVVIVAMSPDVFAAAKAPMWEVVRVNDRSSEMPVNSDSNQPAFEVEVRDGLVYVSTDATVKVEVFTILGQLVTSHTISPGLVRLRIGNRGIYILKGAGTTRRVNL